MGLGIPEISILLITLAIVAFVLWMLVDVTFSKRGLAEKLVWAVGIIVLFPLAAPYYFFTERGKSRSS